MSNLDIRNFTRRSVPVFAYQKALDAVLPGWDISLVFAGETRAQSLNQTLRNKDYVPNVLSYESGKKSGEIVICLSIAERQAPSYGLSYKNMTGYLFIHALLHLKGLPHGATMDKQEHALLKRLTNVVPLNGPKDSNRH